MWLIPLHLIMVGLLLKKMKVPKGVQPALVLLTIPFLSLFFHAVSLFVINLIPIIGKMSGVLLYPGFTLLLGRLAVKLVGSRVLLGILISLLFLGAFGLQHLMIKDKVSFEAGGDVYYLDGATKDDARRVGEFLKVSGVFYSSGDPTVQVVKRAQGYAVRFISRVDISTDREKQRALAEMGWRISRSIFGSQNVVIELCDQSFETRASIKMEAPPEESTSKEEDIE